MGKKEKKPFKMPHLLWIMFGIIVLACLATYLIPAGEFAVNEAGQITGTDFHFLGHQTPVSPWGSKERIMWWRKQSGAERSQEPENV